MENEDKHPNPKLRNVLGNSYPYDYTCPITRDLFCMPAIARDGFTYEREDIEKWYEGNRKSPIGGIEIVDKTLWNNRVIEQIVNRYKYLLSSNSMGYAQNKYSKQKIIHLMDEREQMQIENAKTKLNVVLGHYYQSTWDLSKVLAEMNKLYKIAPHDLDISHNYCNMLRFAERYEDAQYTLKKMKELNPLSIIPNYIGIRTYAENGKREEAQKEFDELLISRGIEDHTMNEIKFAAYANNAIGRRDQAGQLIHIYLSLFSSDLRAQSCKIYIDLQNKQYNKVIVNSNKYLEKWPDDVSILFHKALAFSKLKKHENSWDEYGYILKITKDKTVKAKCHYEMSHLIDSETGFEEIIKHLKLSNKYYPKQEADVYLAALYLDKQMYNECEKWVKTLEKRVDINKDIDSLYIKAECLEGLRKHNEAITSYVQLTKLDAENAIVYNKHIDNILKVMQIKNSPKT